MLQIADDLSILDGRPRYGINVYLVGDVLIDAGTRYAADRILRQMKDLPLAAHAVTHAHPDHQGASHRVCAEFDIPLLCGDGDADAMESGDFASLAPVNPVTRWQMRFWVGPAHPVARRLKEGDVVGGFTVLETPGHSPGSVCFWRDSDRVLIVGDVLFGQSEITGRPGLHEPPRGFTLDPGRNRESIRRLAALNPATVCFGHGPVLDNRDNDLARFADTLKDDL
ncbi:MBL fold metallo-hydrolase [Nocardia sp. NPDC059240]|uniref:MBL fold metallo-hydrolase n=1 Tax=Nocardia sp. NPDC059240 TaxID=3346786 RepID=UPI00367C56CB